MSLKDIPAIFEATRSPGFNDGMQWDAPADATELLLAHEQEVEAWRDGTSFCFSIDDRETKAFVGRIVIRPESNPVWNIGFWTHPVHQRKGYMTEAASRMMQFGFEELKAHRIVASHALGNEPSRRVLEKIGMHFVEHIAQGFLKNGEWVAEDLYAISHDQWAKLVSAHSPPHLIY